MLLMVAFCTPCGINRDPEIPKTIPGTTVEGEGIIACKRATHTNLELIATPLDVPRCTNIICTMGPKCWDADTMSHLIDAGMDVIRLNFSHGSHEAHQEVRSASELGFRWPHFLSEGS